MRRLAVDPPLTAKVRTDPARRRVEVWMVASAASLLEGDELTVALRVDEACTLVVRTVAAQLVHPSVGGATSQFAVHADIGPGATLHWRPEPTIVTAGARYRAEATVRLAADARCTWRDELVLGRSGEDASEVGLETALRVDHGDRPLLRDGIRSAHGWLGPAVLGGARYVGAVHVLGSIGHSVPTEPVRGWFTLAGPGRSARVLDTDPARGRCRLDALAPDAEA